MICKLCGSENIKIIYHGYIRDGRVCHNTESKVDMFQCNECDVIWHEKYKKNYQEYYKSEQYRRELEGDANIETFYELHDRENFDKLLYTGVENLRNKVIADIGCGGGAFLDLGGGMASSCIAIEPSEYYQQILRKKGYHTFSYAADAFSRFKGQVDLITSFDVIEHVDEPMSFVRDAYELLSPSGLMILGTPTDAPVMRKLLCDEYENRLLYSVQHLWIFGENNLRLIAQKAGFTDITVEYHQRYGIGNFISWLIERKPKGHVKYDFLTDTLDEVFKRELEKTKQADYIVIKGRK